MPPQIITPPTTFVTPPTQVLRPAPTAALPIIVEEVPVEEKKDEFPWWILIPVAVLLV